MTGKQNKQQPVNIGTLSQTIRATGFVLENRVATILKSAGWTVISNKYYVDDLDDKVREIDLIAYKVADVQGFDSYTCIIISCKKSEADYWAFLSREAALLDPNFEWRPLHAWTNVPAMKYQLAGIGIGARYHDELAKLGVQEVVRQPASEVFAFQEMKRSTGAPNNDATIFLSITSLIKAQAYELGALPARKKSPCVYQFNLVTVVDAELVKLQFKGEEIQSQQIEQVDYFSRYIVKKNESFARIRFLNAEKFSGALKDYDRLHLANITWFGQQCDLFYKGILGDAKRWMLLKAEFLEAFGRQVRPIFRKMHRSSLDLSDIFFSFDDQNNHVEIMIKGSDEEIKYLNENDKAKNLAANALKLIYRFTGTFNFAIDDIPF